MDKTVFISLPIEDLQALIVDCVNSCLKHNPPNQNPQIQQADKQLTAEQAAEFLGITLPTLYSKKSKGELPACKAPGSKRLFFFKSDLIAYLKQGRQKTNFEIEAEADNYLVNKKTA